MSLPLQQQRQSPPPLPDQQPNKNEQMGRISPKSNYVSTIIRSYKSAVTKHTNRTQLEFAWQTRFHDHIIRNAQSFETIHNYILNNPLLWKEDQFNLTKPI